MKRVLIAGANSYVARSFMRLYGDKYECHAISVRDDAWLTMDLADYRAVLWCAAIVHRKQRKEDVARYFSVNRDIPVAFAKAAAHAGVQRFVFLSTMAVYGQAEGAIDPCRTPTPRAGDWYALSKWEAEQKLRELENERFQVAVLRPPMIVGSGAPGNFSRFVKLLRLLPFFPNYPNARSICPIEVLCAEIAKILDAEDGMLFDFDQLDYPVVSTTDLARSIAKDQGIPIRFTKVFNPLIRCLTPRFGVFRKLFGDLYYCA